VTPTAQAVATPLVATPDPADAGATADAALRRPASWPEWLGASSLVAGPALAGWSTVTSLLGRPPACLVRTTIGLPCPLCGGTTAGRALLDLDLPTAVAASPLALVLPLGAVTMLAVWFIRMAGAMSPPRQWSPVASRRAGVALTGTLVASWAYQCLRLA
jgi:hypothetical protein